MLLVFYMSKTKLKYKSEMGKQYEENTICLKK